MSFDLESVGSGVLKLKAATGDQLALDDVAYAVINPPRRSRVLLVTRGNEPLRLALQTKEAAEIADVQIESPGFLKTKAYTRRSGVGRVAIGDLRPLPARADADEQHVVHRQPSAGGRLVGGGEDRRAADHRHRDGPSAAAMDRPGRRAWWPRRRRWWSLTAAGCWSIPTPARCWLWPPRRLRGRRDGFCHVDEGRSGGATKRFMGTNWMIRPSFPVFVLNVLD